MRVAENCLHWADAQVSWPYGECLGFVRTSFGIGPRDYSAAIGWSKARYRHTSWPPPAAVPVWWTGGSHGYGHVALSRGGGVCRSTDVLHSGRVNNIPISLVHQAWGHTYVGWSEDIEGVHVYAGSSPAPTPNVSTGAIPTVDLSNVVAAFKADPRRPQGHGLHEHDVFYVEAALRLEGLLAANYAGDGYAGTLTREAYRKWQHRLGYTGAAADGFPGVKSLQALGRRHRFRVVY